MIIRFNDMNSLREYDRIYIAPHPDDAALSCGGTIASYHKQGERQLVITLCSGIPANTQTEWKSRLDEEERGLYILGADCFLGGFLDAPFRHSVLTESNDCIGASLIDDSMRTDVEQLLKQFSVKNGQAILYAPLGVGMHTDHLIAFDAALKVAKNYSSVHFYEDFPYTIKDKNALKIRLNSLGIKLVPKIMDISDSIQKKIDAVSQYVSQFYFLFNSFEATVQAIVGEARQVFPGSLGERCWEIENSLFTKHTELIKQTNNHF